LGKQNMTAWFVESGFVGIPKNLLGLMEPLGLSFDDIGRIVYLLYCGCDKVKKTDKYAQDAVKALVKKGMIDWFPDAEKVDFSPMFNLIGEKLGENPVYVETAATNTDKLNYAQFIKKIEKKLARFLSVKEKIEIQKVAQRYNWSFDLIYDMYLFYQSNFRRQYVFPFFAQMAFSAKVEDKESFAQFVEKLNYTVYKVTEVKRRLGQKNYPTEPEKECYLKWANEWKFSHEMILLAVEQTIYGTDPSFKYLDKILENWHKKGIKTPEALNVSLKNRQNKKKIKNDRSSGRDDFEYTRDLSDLVE